MIHNSGCWAATNCWEPGGAASSSSSGDQARTPRRRSGFLEASRVGKWSDGESIACPRGSILYQARPIVCQVLWDARRHGVRSAMSTKLILLEEKLSNCRSFSRLILRTRPRDRHRASTRRRRCSMFVASGSPSRRVGSPLRAIPTLGLLIVATPGATPCMAQGLGHGMPTPPRSIPHFTPQPSIPRFTPRPRAIGLRSARLQKGSTWVCVAGRYPAAGNGPRAGG